VFNEICLIGRLGQEPTFKVTGSGKEVCEVSLATTRGNKETDWHRVVAWEKQAQILRDYTNKGSLVFIKGEVQYSSWTDTEGTKRHKTEIVARLVKLLPKGGGGTAQENQSGSQKKARLKLDISKYQKPEKELSFSAEDIPF